MVETKYLTAWRNRFARQDAESRALVARARADLPQAVEILKKYGAKRVIVFGSLCRSGQFHHDSDIDLAVEGIPPQHFIRAGADLMMGLDWSIDLKPLEEVDDLFRDKIINKGKQIYVE